MIRECFASDSWVIREWFASVSRVIREWFVCDSWVIHEWLASVFRVICEWFVSDSRVIRKPLPFDSSVRYRTWFYSIYTSDVDIQYLRSSAIRTVPGQPMSHICLCTNAQRLALCARIPWGIHTFGAKWKTLKQYLARNFTQEHVCWNLAVAFGKKPERLNWDILQSSLEWNEKMESAWTRHQLLKDENFKDISLCHGKNDYLLESSLTDGHWLAKRTLVTTCDGRIVQHGTIRYQMNF